MEPEKDKRLLGSRKGIPNKVTALSRETFAEFLQKYMGPKGTFSQDWKALEPRERVRAALDMSKLVVPTPKSVDVNILTAGNKPLADRLRELELEEEEG